MCGIVVSRADHVSARIGEQLLDLASWETSVDDARDDAEGGGTVYRTGGVELREFDEWHLDLDGVADAFDDPPFLVFVSRHAGETGPLLTAHFTGNLGPAEHGGRPNELARASPNAAAHVLASLHDHAPRGYEVTMECTHHGPSAVGAPSMFVELGSDEPQWRDDDAARAVARAVLDVAGVEPWSDRTVVHFGGGHYAPRPTRVVRETDWTVGHVAADWGLEALSDTDEATWRDVVEQVFDRSGASLAVVEGDSGVERTVEALGHRVVSETFLRETTGVPLSLVGELEATLCPVEDGLRFGRPARSEGGKFAVREMPSALLAEVQGIDADRTRRLIETAATGFETEENGARASGRAAFPDGGFGAFVDGLIGVLEGAYEAVERRDDAVVARRTTFDPSLARRHGVPEGPKFGRLAAGESVQADGRTVTPADVSREERVSFPL